MANADAKTYAAALREATASRPVATWNSFRKLEDAVERVPHLAQVLVGTVALPAKRRRQEIDRLLGEWPLEIRRLVELLSAENSLGLIKDIGRAYTLLLNREGYPLVRLSSARPLSSAEYRQIAGTLPGDRMKMLFEFVVDPSLIGGVRVEYGDQEYDLTIGGGLDRVAAALEAA